MKTHQKLIIGATLLSAFLIGSVAHADTTQDMYRLYNPNSGEHFYTANVNEKNNLIRYGWKDEGVGWTAPLKGEAVYRLYNPNSGDHHYTLSTIERDHLAKVGWKKEGIGWYSDVNKSVPMYRLYNPYAKTASHHYTINVAESKMLTLIGWKDEGIGWYGVNKTVVNNNTGSNNGSNNNHTNNGNSNVNTGGSTNTGNTNNNNTSKPPVVDNNIPAYEEIAICKEVMNLINNDRKEKNLNLIQWDDQLYEAAKIRAQEMNQSFGHTRPNGQPFYSIEKDINYNKYIIGETASSKVNYNDYIKENNITNKNSLKIYATYLYTGLKQSKPHFQIMMKPNAKYYASSIYGLEYRHCFAQLFAQ